MGLTDTGTIGRIVVHPTNPNIVYVAASGHEWTPNEMRGVFKTTDGGNTWTKSFYRSPNTGAIDLVMIRRIQTRSMPACGSGCGASGAIRVWSPYKEGGIWKTTDAGATWTPTNTACQSRSSAAASVSTSPVRIPTSSMR